MRLSIFVRSIEARVAGVGGRKPETPGLPSLTLSPAPATQSDIDRQTIHHVSFAKCEYEKAVYAFAHR